VVAATEVASLPKALRQPPCTDLLLWFQMTFHGFARELRAARRPKPPSLKEQALAALSEADQGLNKSEWQQRSNTIRRALEQLDD